MKEREIKEKLQQGYIRTNIIFEIIGNPKEYVENALNEYMVNLKKEEDIIVIHEEFEKVEKQENYWSGFAEVELLAKGLEKFTWICFNYMPASVEILEPEMLSFEQNSLTNWINDMLAKLHEVSIVAQQVGSQNKLMLQSINALIRNSILTCLDAGFNTQKDIAAKVGVDVKDLDPVLEAMIQEKKINKDKNKYSRVK